MDKRVLYLGDDTLKSAAGYLGGVMNAAGVAFDHVESRERIDESRLAAPYSAVIISDYLAANFTEGAFRRLVEDVSGGCGLLMIGGWETFHGLNGLYDRSPVASILPVEMEHQDDRVNWPYPCLMSKTQEHEILAGLPFEVPPSIGGVNRVQGKDGRPYPPLGTVLPPAKDRGRAGPSSRWRRIPLLCIGSHGEGRTACYMSDFAPHWCGGSVDWGTPRRHLPCGDRAVEVGSLYARFVGQLVRWVPAPAKLKNNSDFHGIRVY